MNATKSFIRRRESVDSRENLSDSYRQLLETWLVKLRLVDDRSRDSSLPDGRAISCHHPWMRVAGYRTNICARSRKRPAGNYVS
ncbi:hypothetical protein EVAR_48012_1 [Eumeta japonica]|uniref:Uncharacterized protein n=1 Tax=Eumeta variegata TaxID=151549 RepID=A0A4C1XMY9_EUMVA|nr:hypothetical protein EVAR_48012_1 [Eumeta japonica]